MAPVSEPPLLNSERYRFVEFPIYSGLVAVVYLIWGQVEVIYGRQVSVLFSLMSIIFLYLLVRKFLGVRIGLMAAFFFAFLYQLDRPGWSHVYSSVAELIKLGATHFVSVSFDEQTNKVMDE